MRVRIYFSPKCLKANILVYVNDSKPRIPILLFADSILGIQLYDWQCKILLNYEAGYQVAGACANFTGKTSTVFPVAALWTLYNFPHSRVMYLSATSAQVRNQFFASLARFHNSARVRWLAVARYRSPRPKGRLHVRPLNGRRRIRRRTARSTRQPASLLVDEAKSIQESVLDALARCHTTFRLFMSSTGQASGGFYQICTAKAHLWKTFRIPSNLCPHVNPAEIEADRENLKDSVWRIKHGAEWLYDAGDSMISLEHVRAIIDNPPRVAHG